jgi:hypothetical protein
VSKSLIVCWRSELRDELRHTNKVLEPSGTAGTTLLTLDDSVDATLGFSGAMHCNPPIQGSLPM